MSDIASLLNSDFVLTFRRATNEDVSAIEALVNSAYRGESSKAGWTTEADILGGQRTDAGEILSLIEAPGSIILLCLQDSEIIGSVHLERTDEGAYLGMFTVKPVLQGAGIGKQFLAAAERFVQQEWHAHKLIMTVITLRTDLIAYYVRRGYRRTGELREFPQDPRYGMPKVEGIVLEVLEKILR